MEELNQVQTEESVFDSNGEENLFEDENLFDDAEEETTEPAEETNETVEEPPFMKITYNGEEFELNEEDARTLAQKGKNYDKIYDPLQRLTRMHGLNSVGEMLKMLEDTEIEYQISNEVESMKEDPKYEGVSDEVLEEIATAKVNEHIEKSDRDYEESLKASADAENEKVQRDVDKFLNEYPEFREKGPESLDPKVFEYVRDGYTLLEAYNKFVRESPQTKVSKLNEENKKKSLGNTTNAGKVESDDFLNGFLNG